MEYLKLLTVPELEQLKLLTKVTFDGDLISKEARTSLKEIGLVDRYNGFNFITKEGVKVLVDGGIIIS